MQLATALPKWTLTRGSGDCKSTINWCAPAKYTTNHTNGSRNMFRRNTLALELTRLQHPMQRVAQGKLKWQTTIAFAAKCTLLVRKQASRGDTCTANTPACSQDILRETDLPNGTHSLTGFCIACILVVSIMTRVLGTVTYIPWRQPVGPVLCN